MHNDFLNMHRLVKTPRVRIYKCTRACVYASTRVCVHMDHEADIPPEFAHSMHKRTTVAIYSTIVAIYSTSLLRLYIQSLRLYLPPRTLHVQIVRFLWTYAKTWNLWKTCICKGGPDLMRHLRWRSVREKVGSGPKGLTLQAPNMVTHAWEEG